MREKIYRTLYDIDNETLISKIYYSVILIAIIGAVVPILLKKEGEAIVIIDYFIAVIFIIDYFLRWLVADLKTMKGKKAFIMYPFTLYAIFDLLSIAPLLFPTHNGARVLNLIRIVVFVRFVKFFRTLSLSKNVIKFISVLKKQKTLLITLFQIVFLYIMFTALLIYSIEPQTFGSFFNAIYWSVISLTTIGYGDICPTTVAGKLVSMLSAFLGIALITLPASIIFAGYIQELQDEEHKE